MYLCSFIFTVIAVLGCVNGEAHPTVKLNAGELRGHYKKSYGGRSFAAFEGIPYAKPPLGNLRFAEPQRAEPWDGIWEANVIHSCTQISRITKNAVGSEDCLYINVYVPRENPVPNENLDVIVHIHGGAFARGNPESAGPEFLINRDIVYVNFNYRLGVLGFFYTEDGAASGNNGMKDQVLALQWIQENIAQFGGNPSSVTITGESAGGGSVHLHYFSPLSKGLFHRGISQSGVATATWATQKAPLERAIKFATALGCNHTSTKVVVECLRQRSAYQLTEGQQKLNVISGFPLTAFGPVIEAQSSTAFLTDHPINLLNEGKVHDIPWMTGLCTEEGILGYMLTVGVLDQLENDWNRFAPYVLDYDVNVADSDKALVSQKVKDFYFGNRPLTAESVNEIIKLFGDRYFGLEYERASKLQAKVNKSPVYSYKYGYRSTSVSPAASKSIFGTDKNYGVSHAEDGYLLYSVKFNEIPMIAEPITDPDNVIKELLLDIVTSFAKNGKPEVEGITWEPVSGTDYFRYLYIKGPGDVHMVYQKDTSADDFWKSLPIINNYKPKSLT